MPMKKVPTATAQQKNTRVMNGKVMYFDPPNVTAAKQLFNHSLIPHIPKHPIAGVPVRLTTMWLYGTENVKRQGKLKITKPDTDNSIKLLKDMMTELKFWDDDALVAIDQIHKYWAEESKSGIYVKIEILEGY